MSESDFLRMIGDGVSVAQPESRDSGEGARRHSSTPLLHCAAMPEDILIRLAQSRSDYEGCVELQRRVWGLADLEVASTIQLIASTLAGGTVHVAATRDERLVGFAYAFPALRGGSPHLHSDMLAVLPEFQKRWGGRAPQAGPA